MVGERYKVLMSQNRQQLKIKKNKTLFMYYSATIFIPFFIVYLVFIITKTKLEQPLKYINILFKSLPFLIVYFFLIYFLSLAEILDTSWAPYTILFFFIPVLVITIFAKIYYWLK